MPLDKLFSSLATQFMPLETLVVPLETLVMPLAGRISLAGKTLLAERKAVKYRSDLLISNSIK